MWLRNLIYKIQIMKNSPENCVVGSIFVHFSNIVLWTALFSAIFTVVFIPANPVRKLIGIACILGLIADYLCMSSVVPVLDNPFKKNNNNGGGNYLSDIEAATKEAEQPGATLVNLF